ncbi:hypothetical protein [Sphingobium chlorophenolicum]|uniref:hypothetical protein n=1 Tax=Sphingobium chlorophenolicum TaxID=46429 RepID=UPI00117DB663|nr:hypothetical protein [Sphingobium chlorophenolicum]
MPAPNIKVDLGSRRGDAEKSGNAAAFEKIALIKSTLPGHSRPLLIFPKADMILGRAAGSRMSEKLD